MTYKLPVAAGFSLRKEITPWVKMAKKQNTSQPKRLRLHFKIEIAQFRSLVNKELTKAVFYFNNKYVIRFYNLSYRRLGGIFNRTKNA